MPHPPHHDWPGSRLYECRVLHERFLPRRHRFSYRVFYLAVDLDELSRIGRDLPLFSLGGWNVVSLHEDDYLRLQDPLHNPRGAATTPPAPSAQGGTLKQRVLAYCAQHGVTVGPGARVTLVTLPRLFGYAFNPISLYFCRDERGVERCAIVEVTNTYREVKQYFLPALDRGSGPAVFGAVLPKLFYVSPFSPLDATFDFRVHEPGATLAVRIDDHEQGRRTLHSTLTGTARPLTGTWLGLMLLRHPLVTLRVILLIHWQALRLWLKRVPHHPKSGRPDLQRDLRHPHASLIRRSPA
jgi:hypothetical protein